MKKKECSLNEIKELLAKHVEWAETAHSEMNNTHKELKDSFDGLKKMFEPVMETYTGYIFLGKFGWRLLLIVSTILGIIISWRNNFWMK